MEAMEVIERMQLVEREPGKELGPRHARFPLGDRTATEREGDDVPEPVVALGG